MKIGPLVARDTDSGPLLPRMVLRAQRSGTVRFITSRACSLAMHCPASIARLSRLRLSSSVCGRIDWVKPVARIISETAARFAKAVDGLATVYRR